MRKVRERYGSNGIMIAMVLLAVWLMVPSSVAAKTKVVAIEGMEYNVSASLEDNLKALIGKKVSVSCTSGKTLTGVIKKVGDHLVHLEQLSGKEYFDALVRIDTISGIEAPFRKIQR